MNSFRVKVRVKQLCPFFHEYHSRSIEPGGGEESFQHCRLAELYTDDPMECQGLDSFYCFLDRYKEVQVVKEEDKG